MPKRIQRKRTKGWRMPPNTVSVTRPGAWGNCFREGEPLTDDMMQWVHDAAESLGIKIGEPLTREQAVAMYEAKVKANRNAAWFTWMVSELRGKNLACYCPLDKPCHADVLLKWANRKEARDAT